MVVWRVLLGLGFVSLTLWGQPMEFIREGYSRSDMSAFKEKLEPDLFPVDGKAGGGNFWNVEENKPAGTRGETSGYEQLLLIQRQMELEFLRGDGISKTNINALKQKQSKLLSEVSFKNKLTDVNSLNGQLFPQLCAAINKELDPKLETLREENFKHRAKGAMIDPLFVVTGVEGFLLSELVEVEKERAVDNGTVSTPKGFGRLKEVGSLDGSMTNLGAKVLRGIFQTMYGGGWAWAALKVMKECIMESVAMSDFNAACRYSAFAQWILDGATYSNASSGDFGQSYYDKFYRELALAITSVAASLSASQDLVYQYNKLDDTQGDERSRACKKKMNQWLRLAGRVQAHRAECPVSSTEQLKKLPEIVTKLWDQEKIDKGEEGWVVYFLDKYWKSKGGEANGNVSKNCGGDEESGSEKKPFMQQDLETLSKALQGQPSELEKIYRDGIEFDSSWAIEAEETGVCIDLVFDFVDWIRYEELLEKELGEIPTNALAPKDNGSNDGEFGGSCYWCATVLAKPLLDQGRMRRQHRNSVTLSSNEDSANFCINSGAGQAKVLSFAWMGDPGEESLNLVQNTNCYVADHQQGCGYQYQESDMQYIFDQKMQSTNGEVFVEISEFLNEEKIDKKLFRCRKSHPLRPLRFFYNKGAWHFKRLEFKRTAEDVSKLVKDPRRRLMMRIRDVYEQMPDVFYNMYWTPFTGVEVSSQGAWTTLIDKLLCDDRTLWENRFFPRA